MNGYICGLRSKKRINYSLFMTNPTKDKGSFF